MEKQKDCSWCGTVLRGTLTSCPRGAFCETEEKNHEALVERMKEERTSR